MVGQSGTFACENKSRIVHFEYEQRATILSGSASSSPEVRPRRQRRNRRGRIILEDERQVVGFFHGYSNLQDYHPITYRLVPDSHYRVFNERICAGCATAAES